MEFFYDSRCIFNIGSHFAWGFDGGLSGCLSDYVLVVKLPYLRADQSEVDEWRIAQCQVESL